MKTVTVVETSLGQIICLPDEFRFTVSNVSIRRQGEAIVIEPIKPDRWPVGLFDAIRIDDPAFTRPVQGQVPPAPSFD